MRQKLLLAVLLFTATAQAQKIQAPQQQDILKSMRLANSYFMNKWPDPGKEIVTNIARPSNIWTRAVYYEGLMGLYSIDPQKEYYDYAVSWGTKHHWMPRNGVTDRNADDQCAGQTWIDLYSMDPQTERVANIKTCIDNMVHSDKCDDWHWIDAIQMAMPVFVRLGVLYHDTSYFRKMYDLYHFTKTVHGGHGLYNPEEHLWWRDKDFVPPYKEPNGQNCYWSRGNGWVLAALARTLDLLPLSDPHRAEYLQDYLDMVKAIIPLQRADGYWNVSLHDSTHFGGPELSGTALFTYSIAWGIREGYLDKKAYMPVITKSWDAMTTVSLHPDGMLGYVQGTGKEPKDGQPLSYDKIPDFEDYGLGCFLLAGSEIYQIATPPAANLDESKVPPYNETPIPLTTVKNWEITQRPAIYQQFEKNVYGRMPTATIPVTYTTEATDGNALNGTAIKKLITIHFSASDTGARLHLMLYLPKQKRKAPVFVGFSFTPNAVTDTSRQWPIKDIIARGYGVAVAWYWDIEPDRADGWQTGIRTRLAGPLQIQPYEWSAMGAWAWGLERIVDYLQTDPLVDAGKLAVIGHSRLGKAAVWAGASDKRFALVVSNESGEGGAALGKRDYGETIAIINDKFPWWFGRAYKQYGADPGGMPTDQFELLSLIAPRPLYVASAVGDQWSDPKGEFLSARLAAPVYGLYHEKGVGVDSMPPLEHPVGEFIRYHIRRGKHDLTLYDWQQYMNFADQRLKNKR
ncbi:MAG TPA: glycoside hydrolase family 88 protein [Puia sp.]|nr:glycoside hydrolase family 88 protein [Puia sp.]